MKKMKSTLLVTLLLTYFVYSQSSSTNIVSDNNALALSGIAGSGVNSELGGTYGSTISF